MDNTPNLVGAAIAHIGVLKLAKAAGLYPGAVSRWKKNGRLPSSELIGNTQYAHLIEDLSRGRFPAVELLAETRREWQHRAPRSRPRRVDPALDLEATTPGTGTEG